MNDRDQERAGWDQDSGAPPDDSEDGSRYSRTVAEYGGEPETTEPDYRISSDPGGVRGHAIGRRTVWPWLVLLLVAVLAAWAWVELRSADDGGDEVPLATAEIEPQAELPPSSPAEARQPAAIELPELDASDQVVAELVAGLSSYPEVARYLVGEGLVRRFTATVDNIAHGTSPRTHLPALKPESGFSVSEADGTPRPTPAAYGRYDGLAEIFLSLDTAGTAELYRQLEPLIEESYRELGYPDSEFDDTLRTAIDHLLATPDPPPAAALQPRGIGKTFEYSDERYESLSPAQKHLLRMGPDNVRRVKSKLRELRAALAL